MNQSSRLFGIQGAMLFFSIIGVLAKLNSGNPVGSIRFMEFFGLQLVISAIYAYLWQQILKSFQISIAYTHRATAMIWTLLWSVLIFGETFTLNNALGTLLIFSGIALGVNE